MRMSELSAETGVSVATLKYYLREGLLPAGEALGATRADYAEAHVERVRLIRALVETAGLSISAVRKVTDALDNPPATRSELLGVAAGALPVPHADHAVSEAVRDLLDALGWNVPPDTVALSSLSAAVEAGRSAGLDLTPETLRAYAEGCLTIARVDVGAVLGGDPARALTTVVVGTILGDPIVAALRRLAHVHVALSATDPQVAAEAHP